MNKKYVFQNVDNGRILSCVLDGDKKTEDQLEQILMIRKGGGLAVVMREDGAELMDYFHASSAAFFKLLSSEDTELPVSLKWTEEN